PEIVLSTVVVVVLVLDLLVDETRKYLVTQVAGLGVVASAVPLLSLAARHGTHSWSMFGGAYVVDNFSLVLKALFIFTGYIVLLTAVMLYGMSLIFGFTGTTVLSQIGAQIAGSAGSHPIVTVGIFFVVVGFAFKVSAVPFHFWAPDVYEGAPTPVTAFLSVASKTGGFVALFQLIFVGFYGRYDVYGPLFWVLAALTMTVGNLVALRQTNIVRMLAYSSIGQAGYI